MRDRELMQMERVKRQQEHAESLQAEKEIENSMKSINEMIENELIRAGYHKVYGQWRKRRITK